MTHSALDSGALVSATAQNATSAVATIAAVAGKRTYIINISGSTDKAGGRILIKDGSTTIWQDRLSNTCPGIYDFDGYLVALGAVTVTVDGTVECDANILAVQL